MLAFAPGTLIDDRYRIVRLLGEGGMGSVWEAIDEDSSVANEQGVALKFLKSQQEADDNEKAELELHSEVAHALRVTHPNVCRIYGFENLSIFRRREDERESTGPAYIIMEHIGGENLYSILKRFGKLHHDKSTEISLQICEGLIEIHRCGIVHSDLTPKNIQIDAYGQVKIMDFGVSAGHGEKLRGGTPIYMAPEQFQGKISEKSDIYSLGLVLFNLFSGSLFDSRFGGTEIQTKILDLLESDDALASLPEEIRALILSCTSENSSRRPKATEVKVALEQALNVFSWRAESGLHVPGRPELVLQDQIDQREWGQVWTAREDNLDELRILKFCDKFSRLYLLERELDRYKTFVKFHGGTQGAVFKILSVNFATPPFFIELECPASCSLQEWAQNDGSRDIGERERIEIVRSIVEATVAIHSAHLLHLDLRASNIYIRITSGKPRVWLRDVGVGLSGYSANVENKAHMMFYRDNHLYWAPELSSSEDLPTVRADIFSLGVLVYQIVVGNFRITPLGQIEKIEDELLRSDVADATRPDPQERLGFSFLLLAQIQNLEERRARSSAEIINIEAIREVSRAKSRRSLYGRVAGTLAAALALGIVGLLLLWSLYSEVDSQRAMLQRTVDYMDTVLEIPDPTLGVGELISAKGLLRMSARSARFELETEPEIARRVYLTTGLGLQRLGEHTVSFPLLQEALAIDNSLELRRLGNDSNHVRAKLMNSLAEHYRTQHSWFLAADYNGRAFELVDKSNDMNLYAWVLETRGLIQLDLGNYSEALVLFKEVTGLRRKSLKVKSPRYVEVAVSINNEGVAHLKLDEHELAQEKFKKALEIRRQVWEQNAGALDEKTVQHAWRAKTATLLHNLGSAQRKQSDFVSAERNLSQALVFSKEILGEKHEEVAKTLNELGWLYEEKGEYKKARNFHERALDIRRELPMTSKLSVVRSMQSLAWVAAEEGDFEVSENLYREALNEHLSRQEATHPDVITAKKDLATTLRNKGDIDEAIKLYEEALKAWRAREDGEPEIPFIQTDLALALMAQGNSSKAIETAKDALEAWGEDPFGEAFGLARLALLYEDAGKLELAEENFKAAIEGFRDVLGPNHAVVAETMKKYARFLVDTNAQPAEEAERIIREAIKVFKSDEATPLWRLIHGKAVLGGAFVKQGRLEEAQPILEGAYKNLQDIRGERNEETGDARRYLQELYRKQGKLEKVNELERNLTRAQTEGGRQAA